MRDSTSLVLPERFISVGLDYLSSLAPVVVLNDVSGMWTCLTLGLSSEKYLVLWGPFGFCSSVLLQTGFCTPHCFFQTLSELHTGKLCPIC